MFKSHVKLIVLKQLSKEKMSGYDLMKSFGDSSKKPSPGYIYPLLSDLQKKGFISVKKDGRKKIYSITEKGIKLLDNLRIKREETMTSFVKILEPITEKNEIQSFIKSKAKKEKNNLSLYDQFLLKNLHTQIFSFYKTGKDKDKKKMRKILKETIKKLESFK